MKLGLPPDDDLSFDDESFRSVFWEILFVWERNWPSLPARMRAHPAQRRLIQVIKSACENLTYGFTICSEADMRAQLVVAIDAAQDAGDFVIGDLTHGWARNNGEA